MKIQGKFVAFRHLLSSALIERDEEIDIALTALIVQEHVLLVGQPGTGKSLLADTITSWVDGAKFSICLNKFSTPEEVFGPISLAGLRADEYRRITDGKLPTADIAFIDEIFKASSAILNTMLTVLNERTYVNNGVRCSCPLKLAIAASNEWPAGAELGALFDRFLFRKTVRPIGSPQGRERLLWAADLVPHVSQTITGEEVTEAFMAAMAIPWTAEAKEALSSILGALHREGICPGDRRIRKAVKAAQGFAYLEGDAEVTTEHLGILAHVLWSDPAEQPKIVAATIAKHANPATMKTNSLWAEADELMSTVGTGTEALLAAHGKLKTIAAALAKLPGERAKEALAHTKESIKTLTKKVMDIDSL